MNKLTIVQQYSKYLEAITKDGGSSIPTLFGKLRNFLVRERDNVPNEFWQLIYLHCIKMTVAQLKEKKVHLKPLSRAWSVPTLKEFGRLLEDVKKYSTKEDDEDALKSSYEALKSLIDTCDDTAMQLFMNMQLYSSSFGKGRLERLSDFDNVVLTLLTAESEEDLDKALGITSTNTEEALEVDEGSEINNEALRELIDEYTKWLDSLEEDSEVEKNFLPMRDYINEHSPMWLKGHLLQDCYINCLRASHNKPIETSLVINELIDSNCSDEMVTKAELQLSIFEEGKPKRYKTSWLPTLYKYFSPQNQEELDYMLNELKMLSGLSLITSQDFFINEVVLQSINKTKKFITENSEKSSSFFLQTIDEDEELNRFEEEEAEAAEI